MPQLVERGGAANIAAVILCLKNAAWRVRQAACNALPQLSEAVPIGLHPTCTMKRAAGEVTYEIDANDILNMSAADSHRGVQLDRHTNERGRLLQATITAWYRRQRIFELTSPTRRSLGQERVG